MADVVLFHHARGLTPGVQHFAERLRARGHTVSVPDLFEGRTFDSIEAGVEHARGIGFDTLLERGTLAVAGLPPALVYAGLSLGVMPAQMLAQTRADARGALLYHACVPLDAFGGAWPAGVPVQIHAMDQDPLFVGEGDIDAARDLVARADAAELLLYPGDAHLFSDDSLPEYDRDASDVLLQRSLQLLQRVSG